MKITFVFQDESGVSDRPFVRRTWAPRGKTPTTKSAGGWKTRSVSGCIATTAHGTKTRLFLRIFKGTVRSEEVILVLKDLRRHIKGKILLLWDGLPAHRSKLVKDFLAREKRWIEVHRLPAYAPETNPVEYFWSSMKRKDLGNFLPETMDDLENRMRKSVRRVRRGNLLSGFLRASGLFQKH